MSNLTPTNSAPTISIVIPTRNRAEELVNLLKTIVRQTITPQELIIVDGSDLAVKDHPEFSVIFKLKNFSQTNLIYTHTNKLGSATQRNTGAQLATCDLIAFIDDDMLLDPDYLKKLRQVFIDYPDCKGAMGAIDGTGSRKITFNRLLRNFFLLQREGTSGQFTFSGMPTHAYGAQKITAVAVLNGLAVYNRKLFLQFEFDEQLGRYAYMEDCDLSQRIARQNHLLLYVPAARSAHIRSTNDRSDLVANRALYLRNYSYLFFKNFYPDNKFRILGYFWTVLGLFTEALLARNRDYLHGYCRGLKLYYWDKS